MTVTRCSVTVSWNVDESTVHCFGPGRESISPGLNDDLDLVRG